MVMIGRKIGGWSLGLLMFVVYVDMSRLERLICKHEVRGCFLCQMRDRVDERVRRLSTFPFFLCWRQGGSVLRGGAHKSALPGERRGEEERGGGGGGGGGERKKKKKL